MIKIGTYPLGDETLSFEERMQILKDVGFDYICLSIGGLASPKVREVCERLELEIGDVHLTGDGTHALWAEGEEGDRIAQRYCDEIRTCSENGVKTAVLHALYGYAEPAPMGEIGLSRFLRIVECAEKNGVRLALENSLFDRYLCFLLERIKSPYFGYCFDSGHHHAFAREMDLLSMWGDRLCATHLQDNDGERDLHLYPLDGTMDWKKTAEGLARCPHARERICAEVVRVRDCKMKGLRAEELVKKFEGTRAYRDGLLQFSDEHVLAYGGMSFEQSAQRLYLAMKEIAADIERAAARA